MADPELHEQKKSKQHSRIDHFLALGNLTFLSGIRQFFGSGLFCLLTPGPSFAKNWRLYFKTTPAITPFSYPTGITALQPVIPITNTFISSFIS